MTISLTLALAAAVGALLLAIAPRLKLPSIALLLGGGIVLGPEGLGIVQPETLGPGLRTIVQLAVAIILFEGGLTLDLSGYRKASKTIIRLLTVGVAVTWFGSTLALWIVLDLPPVVALLGGSLVIVTGPTVVSPLLRRLGVRDRLYHVLYWEGVLIDAVGVFVAILCFEWVTAGGFSGYLGAVGTFGLRLIFGLLVGGLVGLGLDKLLRSEILPRDQINIVVLTVALLLFGACDMVLHESGILAVIIAGLVLGVRKPPQLKSIKRFKLELTELSIGLLFILLSARLELQRFWDLRVELAILLIVVMFLLRPISVLLATRSQDFDWRDRVFMSWLAPRGIVAASMSSLVALELGREGIEGSVAIETFTFAVIGATVVVQGLTAPLLVRWLRLEKPPRDAWLILGEASLALEIGHVLSRAGAEAVVVGSDLDPDCQSCGSGMAILQGDPLDPDLISHPALGHVGWLLSVSSNAQLNRLVCRHWGRALPSGHIFRWSDEKTATQANKSKHGQPVWTHLPSPAEMAHGLEAAAARFAILPATEAVHLGCDDQLLFTTRGSDVSMDGAWLGEKGTCAIVLRAPVPHLAGLIQGAHAFEEGISFEAALLKLLEDARGVFDGVNVKAKLEEIVARKALINSVVVGEGIVIPHAYCEGLKHPQAWIGTMPSKIQGVKADVRLIFLVLSPKHAAEAHLQSLAALAHLGSDEALIKRLTTATTPDEILRLIRARE